MLNSINTTNQLNAIQNLPSNYSTNQLAFRGKTDYERTPEVDTFEGKKKHTGRNITIGTLIALAITTAVDHFAFKGKYRTRLFEFVKTNWNKLIKKETSVNNPTTQTKIHKSKAGRKNKGGAGKPRKNKLQKHKDNDVERSKTIIQKNSPNPIKVTETTSQNTVNNIDTSHVDARTRNIVEKSKSGLVSPEQQAKYDKEIAYQPLNQGQRNAKAALEFQNTAQRRELNSIGSLTGKTEEVASAVAKSQKGLRNGKYVHPNGNVYYYSKGKVSKIELFQRSKNGVVANGLITDPVKIAKHLGKHNIESSSLKMLKPAQRA